MEKIASIANQLYQHGIEEAEHKAAQIIANAEQEANALLVNTKKQAVDIETEARQNAEKTRNNIEGELKLAGTQTLNEIRRNLVDLISNELLSQERKDLVSDPQLLKELIIEIAKIDASGASQDWEILLPAVLKEKLSGQVQKDLVEALKNPKLVFNQDLSGGFRIRRQDQDFHLDFSNQALEDFFRRFLKEKTIRLLFGE